MKIRWREHELTLVTLLAVVLLSGYVWRLQTIPTAELEAPFREHQVAFNQKELPIGESYATNLKKILRLQ
jgi:hypothetical protein